jgi:hypothetical protein
MIRNTFSLFFLFVSTLVIGQSSTGSPYSFGGLGEITFRGNQLNRTMGGLEVYNDSIHVNLNNPAGYATLRLTNYALGINYKTTALESTSNKTSFSTAGIDYLAVNIPAGKFGFGFGIKPYSTVGYRLELLDESGPIARIDRFEGEGGLNQAFLSVGFKLSKYFSVGMTVNYGFGNLTYRNSQRIEDVQRSSYFDSNSSLSGISTKFAVNGAFPIKKLTLHTYFGYAPAAEITSTNAQLYYTRSGNNSDISDFQEIDLAAQGIVKTILKLPKNTTFGMGLGKERKWFAGAQYGNFQTSTFSNAFISLPTLTYADGNRFAVGGFYIPDYTSLTNFFKKWVYRVGYRKENTGLLVNGQQLNESGISFGVGIPLQQFSNVNVGFELGNRGKRKELMIAENYWAFMIGFSLNDVWFIKKKYN